MMPYRLLALLLLLSPVAHGAATETGCAAKRSAVEQQLLEARQQGHDSRAKGLEKALGKIDRHCTDAGLQRQRLAEVEAKTAKLQERQAELEEAMLKGDKEKLAKRKAKLEEARQELEDAKAELKR